jgi:hypothetical protein
MTSLSIIGREQQHLEGRTVRDIVEYSPDQVNEVWCRKIFRQILQSLELQYAMHMPHRAITPDTVVFHDNGEPLLIPSDVAAPRFNGDGSPDDVLRDDLTALASIVHYAITHELAPTGSLRGRAPAGYSDSLLGAVDLCMSPDPAERPRTIEALRDLLGIVALGPAIPPPSFDEQPQPAVRPARMSAPSPPGTGPAAAPAEAPLSFLREPDQRRPGLGLSLTRWQRWALAAGGAAMLLAVALTVFATLRDSGSYDEIALRLPQQTESGAGQAAQGGARPAPLPAPAMAPAPSPMTDAAPPVMASAPAAPSPSPSSPSPQAQAYAEGAMGTSGMAGVTGADAQAPQRAPVVTATPGAPPKPATTDMVAGAGAGAGYRLQIQPWGTVYVDGVDRGVSPPIKRLVLAPGRHTIRVTNPNYDDRVLEVDATGGDGRIAIDFGAEPQE